MRLWLSVPNSRALPEDHAVLWGDVSARQAAWRHRTAGVAVRELSVLPAAERALHSTTSEIVPTDTKQQETLTKQHCTLRLSRRWRCQRSSRVRALRRPPRPDYGNCEVTGATRLGQTDDRGARRAVGAPGTRPRPAGGTATRSRPSRMASSTAWPPTWLTVRVSIASIVVSRSFRADPHGQAKGFDIALSEITITDERKKVVNFTEPYFELRPGRARQGGHQGRQGKHQETAACRRAGHAPRCNSSWTTSSRLEHPKVFAETSAMYAALAAGQVDAVLYDTPNVLARAKTLERHAARWSGRYDTGEKWGGLVNKDSPNLAAFNQLIDEFKKDGTLERLSEQVSDPEPGHGSRPSCPCSSPEEHRTHGQRNAKRRAASPGSRAHDRRLNIGGMPLRAHGSAGSSALVMVAAVVAAQLVHDCSCCEASCCARQFAGAAVDMRSPCCWPWPRSLIVAATGPGASSGCADVRRAAARKRSGGGARRAIGQRAISAGSPSAMRWRTVHRRAGLPVPAGQRSGGREDLLPRAVDVEDLSAGAQGLLDERRDLPDHPECWS